MWKCSNACALPAAKAERRHRRPTLWRPRLPPLFPGFIASFVVSFVAFLAMARSAKVRDKVRKKVSDRRPWPLVP